METQRKRKPAWLFHRLSQTRTHVMSREPFSSPSIGLCCYHCSPHLAPHVFSSSDIHLWCDQSCDNIHISYPRADDLDLLLLHEATSAVSAESVPARRRRYSCIRHYVTSMDVRGFLSKVDWRSETTNVSQVESHDSDMSITCARNSSSNAFVPSL
jgi:hypothetical protein